ncbi:MAG: protein-L-isoaspartate(D-aspartate) O-methyltransferase [Candidatus Thermoplasmatota archaeon]|nr:protein-L-isoaspartate(D-aspartate) O-methyltransferase [Candidatus Thermoplasmatota archaeon]
MVQLLKMEGIVRTGAVEKAMLETPRHIYVPEGIRHLSYEDAPLPIGEGQTISAPHMVAIMCEALQLKPGEKVLEIGAGSGYHAAVMSRIVGGKGMIFSVERIEAVAKNATLNLEADGRVNVKVVIGDGTMGLPEFAPYDAITVTCAAPEIPKPLIEQIREGGRILIPIGRMPSDLILAIKNGPKLEKKNLGGCMFVPMVGEYGFKDL